MSVTDKKYSSALAPGQSPGRLGFAKGTIERSPGRSARRSLALHSRIAFPHCIPALYFCIGARGGASQERKKNDPEWIRTTDRRIRNLVLYPTELRDQSLYHHAMAGGENNTHGGANKLKSSPGRGDDAKKLSVYYMDSLNSDT